MITNVITKLPDVYVMNMTDLAFQGGINMPRSTSSARVLMDIPTKPERLSSHGGKRSLESLLNEREQKDTGFKSKMIKARQALAEEINEVSPEDSLVKRRLSKGLSQQRLANILGTTQAHISKIEAGNLKIYFDTAIKLADALDVSLDDLRKLVEVSNRPQLHIVAS